MVQQVNAAAKKELTERINQVGQKSIGEVHPRAFLSASRGRIFHHDQDRFTLTAFVVPQTGEVCCCYSHGHN